ncbi:type 2 lanthipeptide synthetase LanM family protein [Saccharothrix lopnurensis]|uniref:Type 2 lanthipeptide synthetase LanM family protein n=1 Tax=Saccharothrix lopnurensis TaxID=1670621 RepID=A0ABW1PBU1_9PSEU
MTAAARTEHFAPSVDAFLGPSAVELVERLRGLGGLGSADRAAITAGAREALRIVVLRKLARTLVLELHAAKLTGSLRAADSAGRWAEFVDRTCAPGFWDSLAGRYPTLARRLATVTGNRVDAAVEFAGRFVADRAALAVLTGADPGCLRSVDFGAGDSHRAGRTVVVVRAEGGIAVYKPRPLAVDAALAALLRAVLPAEPDPIRVPAVLDRGAHGWAEHITHRYCAGDEELRRFHRNLGRWLAVMRLVGGTDLHQDNLVAAGPVPVVIDCETLFSPTQPARPSGYGGAADAARDLVARSVLGTGLLPGRGVGLGWRGVDASGIGSLPGQQPEPELPVLLGAGTDTARIGTAKARLAPSANHPAPEPVLREHWALVVSSFEEMTDRLRDLDAAGALDAPLDVFADVPVRAVPRGTETYAALGRMLWHPASLHDEPAAAAKAGDLLARHAANTADAPADPVVIAAEVADLLDGDIPYFGTTPARGVLDGPRGTRWGHAVDVLAETRARWRAADLGTDRRVVRAALVSAYLNEAWLPAGERRLPTRTDRTDLERRRRAVVAGIVREIAATAIRGDDGTAAWIAPTLNPTGWAVHPLGTDLYSGLTGVAVVLAAHRREVAAGRADPVNGADGLLAATLASLRLAESRAAADAAVQPLRRPDPPGGYIGLASRITGWLLLRRLGAVGDEAVARAAALAEQLPAAVTEDTDLDLLTGQAGAVVPLLRLAEHTADDRWVRLAAEVGDRLAAAARRDGRAHWPSRLFPDGVGGLAHGSTGIGWALDRLAAATGDPDHAAVAREAFAFEEALYDPDRRGWLDLRNPGVVAGAWCHGAGGIGVAALDLQGRDPAWAGVAARAAASAWEVGTGWNHTLCHGDLGVAELAGTTPEVPDRTAATAWAVAAIEEHGVVTGLAKDAFSPGLLPGAGGIAYGLLRAHPDAELPSVLLPDPGGPG